MTATTIMSESEIHDRMTMDTLLARLRAAAETTRLRILALCLEGDLTVTDLTRILGQSQPRVSRHLKLLCEAGLLERQQEGAWAFFHMPGEGAAASLVRSLVTQIAPVDGILAQDRRQLDIVKRERAERASAYFRENAGAWDSIRALHVDEDVVERALVEMMPAAGVRRMIDIGTGTGRMLELFGPKVDEAVGIDRSQEMLSVARANLSEAGLRNCLVRQADLYRLPYEDGAFDFGVIHMVLHFAERPVEALEEAARVIAPGGSLVIADFAPHQHEELRERHAHRRLGFRRQEVESWAVSAGLDAVEVRELSGSPLTVTIWKTRRRDDGHDHALLHSRVA